MKYSIVAVEIEQSQAFKMIIRDQFYSWILQVFVHIRLEEWTSFKFLVKLKITEKTTSFILDIVKNSFLKLSFFKSKRLQSITVKRILKISKNFGDSNSRLSAKLKF